MIMVNDQKTVWTSTGDGGVYHIWAKPPLNAYADCPMGLENLSL